MSAATPSAGWPNEPAGTAGRRVKPAPFAYHAPETLDETLALLASGDDTRVLAGGQSLVPLLKARVLQPAVVVDVNRVPGLAGVVEANGRLRIGALTRQQALLDDETAGRAQPLLPAAGRFAGYLATRHRGTVGGSLAFAAPWAELTAAVVALDAQLEIRSSRGERIVSARSFFRGPHETALEPDELLTAVDVPAAAPRTGAAFHEVSVRYRDFAQVAAAATVTVDEAGSCTAVELVLLRVGPVPQRIDASHLVGRPIDAAALATSPSCWPGSSRRTTSRRPAPTASASPQPSPAEPSQKPRRRAGSLDERTAPIRLQVNGAWHDGLVEPRLTLSDFLREDLDLTGTHVACENGFCGNCNVLLDGETVRSCLMFAVQADGRALTTVEGLAAPDGTLGSLQQAFHDNHGLQCGFCTPAMLLTAQEYLAAHPDGGTDEQIRDAISGVLCRCTGYQHIVDSIRAAARRRLHEHRRAGSERRQGRARDRGRRTRPAAGSARACNRVEDPRFLRGQGRYLDDIKLPGMLHAAVVGARTPTRGSSRSTPRRPRRSRASSAVVTGKDVAERAAPLPSFGAGPIVQDLIAIEKVRHYGETVAAVIAENRYVAEDACALIEVVYEQLPGCARPGRRARGGLPARARGARDEHRLRAHLLLRRGRQGLRGRRPLRHRGALLATLDGDADGHERRDRRLRPGHGCRDDPRQLDELHLLPLADRGLAEDPGRQAPARTRRRGRQLRLEVLHAQGADVRRVPLDARRQAGEVRRGPPDHIVNNDHCGSDRRYEASLAFDDDGEFKALRISCVDDYGAYLQFGTGTHGNALSQIVGPYRIQHVEYSLAAVLTNKNQQGAYRGFGAEVSNWILERLVDMAARDLGLDRVEIRRRNLIPAGSFPYRTPTGNIYDSGNYQGVLAKVLEEVDYDHWVDYRRMPGPRAGTSGSASSPRRSAVSSARPSSGSGSTTRSSRRPRARRARASASTRRARSSSRCIRSRCGATALRPWSRRSSPRSSTSIRPRSSSTTRTRRTPCPGTGPGGSRYTVMVSGAVAGASAELKDKIRRIASDKLEVAEADLEFRDGGVGVVGVPDRHLTLADIAHDRVHVPARPAGRHAERSRRAVDLRPPADDPAERRPLRPRHLLSLRRSRLAHRRDRGRCRNGQARVPPLRRRS